MNDIVKIDREILERTERVIRREGGGCPLADELQQALASTEQPSEGDAGRDFPLCPNPDCRSECRFMEGTARTGSWVMCPKCEYCSPMAKDNAAALRLHRAICNATTPPQEVVAKPTHEQWWGWIADVLKAEADRQQWHQGMYPQIADEINESRQALYKAAKVCRFNAEKPRAPLVEPAFAPPANDEAVIELGKECAVSISGFEEDAQEVSNMQTALRLIRHCIELGKQAHARANRNDEAVRLAAARDELFQIYTTPAPNDDFNRGYSRAIGVALNIVEKAQQEGK